MIWRMDILKISQEERRLTMYYVIRHSKLLVIQSTMNTKANLHQWFITFFDQTSRDTCTQIETRISEDQELAYELY